MFPTNKTAAAVLLATITCGAAAMGGISYSYVTDQANYTVSPGGSVVISVLIRETLTSGSPSLIADDGGLDGAAFKVALKSGSGSSITGAAYNPLFDAGSPFNKTSVTPTTASLTESTAFGSPSVGGAEILGTITITGGSLNTVATFEVSPAASTFGTTLTRNNYYDLDHLANSYPAPPATPIDYTYAGAGDGGALNTFVVTVVPEPGTLGLLSLATVFAATRRRRTV